MIEDKVKGLTLGAVDYITKPFNKADVQSRVDVHLNLQVTKKQLLESKQNYLTLVSNIQDGLLLWSPENGIQFVNTVFTDILNIPEKQLLNQTLDSIIANDDLEPTTAYFLEIFNTKCIQHAQKEHECYVKAADDKLIPIACLAGFVEYNSQPMVLATIRDITTRHHIEESLRQTQKLELLGALTSGIAHDFNNILAVINGYTELVLFGLEDDDNAKENLKIVLEAGNNAAAIIKELLRFGKNQSFQLQKLELNKEVERIVEFMSHCLPKKLHLKIIPSQCATYVMGDHDMLQQLIINLCINSRDAIVNNHGEVAFSISIESGKQFSDLLKSEHDNVAVLILQDKGSGIPKEILNKIFTPFFTTKGATKGSGLGLSMVRHIMRKHDGDVLIESEEGKGTKVSLIFPIVE
jgi:PAS domain S-box-containing protein